MLGPDHDYSKEVAGLKESAHGNAVDHFNLGVAYVRGIGTAKDTQEGMKWLRTSAEGGEERASHYLAAMYLAGSDVPADYSMAYFWMIIARAAGHENHNEDVLKTMLSGAQAQEAGRHAVEWLGGRSAIPAYAYQLATDYEDGEFVAKDPQEFAKWLWQAAQMGLASAQLRLGIRYFLGDTTFAVDRGEALKWLRLAGLQGEAKAQLMGWRNFAEEPA